MIRKNKFPAPVYNALSNKYDLDNFNDFFMFNIVFGLKKLRELKRVDFLYFKFYDRLSL